MSLTSILNGKSTKEIAFQNVIKEITPGKQDFYNLSRKESFSKDYIYRVENKLNKSYESSLVGIAFDYLARFIVANFILEGKEEVLKDSVAAKGLENITRKVDSSVKAKLEKKFISGMNNIKGYINGEYILLTKDIIEFSCFLGRLEQVFRSGKYPEDINKAFFKEEKDEVLIQLAKLSELFINKFIMNGLITENSKVIFNPHFGMSSMKCGGADADIFVDGILYDFKTTKNSGYKGKDVQQIIGYYILDCIAKKNKDRFAKLQNERIKKIAFYKGRFGEIELYDLNNIEDENLKNAIEEIEKIISDKEKKS